MIRLSTLFWLILVSATGFAMFAVKYEVQALADELVQTTKQAGGAENEIRVLDAEWAYLNRPDALAQMNQRYLSLVPIATKQLRTGVADVPMRPAPPPPPPVETVAANGTAVASATVPVPQNAPGVDQPESNQPRSNQPRSNQPQRVALADSAAPIITAAFETRVAALEPVKPAPVRSAVRPHAAHRAKSLDDLIAQIAESR